MVEWKGLAFNLLEHRLLLKLGDKPHNKLEEQFRESSFLDVLHWVKYLDSYLDECLDMIVCRLVYLRS